MATWTGTKWSFAKRPEHPQPTTDDEALTAWLAEFYPELPCPDIAAAKIVRFLASWRTW